MILYDHKCRSVAGALGGLRRDNERARGVCVCVWVRAAMFIYRKSSQHTFGCTCQNLKTMQKSRVPRVLCHEVHRLEPSNSFTQAAAGRSRANRSTLGGLRVGAMPYQ